MSDLAAFSELVGDLYDAALETALFPAAMEKINTYLDGAATVLISEDVLHNEATFVSASAVDQEWAQRYFGEFMHINPVRGPSLPFLKTGDAFSTLTFVTDDEFRASRYYQEWFRPKGLLDTMHSVLDRSAMHFNLLSCTRFETQGYATRTDLERMTLIAPHVRRAIGISRLMEMKTFEVGRFVTLVDRLSAAVIFTDAGGRIAHVNAAAAKMLDAGTLIRRRGGRLTAVDDRTAAVLASTLASALLDPLQQGDGAAIMLPDSGPAGTSRHVAHVLPLRSGHCGEAGREYGATAAVFIRDVGVDPISAAASLSQVYDLTRRELSVLLALVADHSVPDAAAILGLSEQTVKTHLKSIFRKVGVHKQSALATLVAGIANPFSPQQR
jgi:DNA-binding CsgD family transcriptional regulator/PAS domain-containing protein